VAVTLALLASLTWGTADFLGGTAARRLPAAVVVVLSQTAGLAAVLVVAAATGRLTSPLPVLGWALAAGVCGAIGLTAFYAALAAGTMGVVAPLAALGVLLPVAVGLAGGDRPTGWQGLGVAVAVVGVVGACGPELRGHAPARRPLLLAALAGVSFGAVNVLIAGGATSSPTMTLLVMRVTSVSVVFAGLRRAGVSARASRRTWPLLAATGFGDVGANALFAVASTRGYLSVVSVLSSLYPVVTVLLARAVHDERVRRVQGVGVTLTLAGVALIASGGAAG
jgi:drug/metabolite transporter (DMT)-like permease